MKVLIAVDNSKFAKAAVESVVQRPWWGDTRFLVLSVAPKLVPSYLEWPASDANAVAEIQAAQRKEHEKLVDTTVEYMSRCLPDCLVDGKVSTGAVCDEIIRVAQDWSAELIVIGSHGRTGLTKFFLGSIAEAVLHSAPCSVEIVRISGKEADQEELTYSKTA